MAINKVSSTTKSAIIRKSVKSLPNKPSDKGYKAEEIKKAMYEPITGEQNSVIAEIDRVVDEVNAEFEKNKQTHNNHAENKNNPHNVTKEQVGLSNVDNTSDANKPVSDPQRAEFDKKISISDLIDSLTSSSVLKPLTANQGRILKGLIDLLTDNINDKASSAELLDLSDKFSQHKNSSSNPHGVNKSQIGLDKVDNTADIDKPISTLQQEALNQKLGSSDIVNTLTSTAVNKVLSAYQGYIIKSLIDGLSANLDEKVSIQTFLSELQKKIDNSLKGVSGGVAELDDSGKVPTNQLPMDILEQIIELIDYSSSAPTVVNGEQYYNSSEKVIYTGINGVWASPTTPSASKIYFVIGGTHSNKQYRWSGSELIMSGSPLVLGETSSNAFRGDRGKIAYEHSQKTNGNPHNVSKTDIGLDKVNNTSDSEKPVSSQQQVELDKKINYTDVVNSLSDKSENKPLSANQGSVLKGLIDSLNTAISNLGVDELQSLIEELSGNFNNHTSNKSNPHTVTKQQIGLGNVENTADASKSVFSASQLTTARKLNGVPFNGTEDVTIYDDSKVPIPSGVKGGTATKITYDSFGRVLSGEGLSESDIPAEIPRQSAIDNIGNQIEQINANINKKLDKNVGAANSGKIMKVNAAGEIIPEDAPEGITVINDLNQTETANWVKSAASAHAVKEVKSAVEGLSEKVVTKEVELGLIQMYQETDATTGEVSLVFEFPDE